ncbi:MAG: DsbC family protein [Pseudomonadales bacterium]|nr:DsbC family protein [Pseudomonadales bacterium]
MNILKVGVRGLRNSALFCALMLADQYAIADSPEVQEINNRIKTNIQLSLRSAKVTAITATSMEGIYQVEMASGEVVYSNEQGTFIISGDLYQLNPGARSINITENWRGKQRVNLLADLDLKDMVVFSPEGETKGVVYAFTDVDCGYCQKFHSEIPKLNSLGVEIRYLAWPRAGLKSATGDKMRSVWCAKDRKTAMTKAKRRLALETPQADCETPIEEQLLLGHKMGVRGTPSLYLANGTRAGGYVKAVALATKMGITSETKIAPVPPFAPN